MEKAPSCPLYIPTAHTPSYISERWALSFHGVIPEKVPLLTAVSTRVTRTFSNAFGEYRYRTIATPLFYGFHEQEISLLPILLASPEKALLDLWYLESGEWTIDRMVSFRFNPHTIENKNLCSLQNVLRRHGSIGQWTLGTNMHRKKIREAY